MYRTWQLLLLCLTAATGCALPLGPLPAPRWLDPFPVRHATQQAWLGRVQAYTAYCGKVPDPVFERGWKAGYGDVLAGRNANNHPSSPPASMSEEPVFALGGKSRLQRWQQGWNLGAVAAQADGLGNGITMSNGGRAPRGPLARLLGKKLNPACSDAECVELDGMYSVDAGYSGYQEVWSDQQMPEGVEVPSQEMVSPPQHQEPHLAPTDVVPSKPPRKLNPNNGKPKPGPGVAPGVPAERKPQQKPKPKPQLPEKAPPEQLPEIENGAPSSNGEIRPAQPDAPPAPEEESTEPKPTESETTPPEEEMNNIEPDPNWDPREAYGNDAETLNPPAEEQPEPSVPDEEGTPSNPMTDDSEPLDLSTSPDEAEEMEPADPGDEAMPSEAEDTLPPDTDEPPAVEPPAEGETKEVPLDVYRAPKRGLPAQTRQSERARGGEVSGLSWQAHQPLRSARPVLTLRPSAAAATRLSWSAVPASGTSSGAEAVEPAMDQVVETIENRFTQDGFAKDPGLITPNVDWDSAPMQESEQSQTDSSSDASERSQTERHARLAVQPSRVEVKASHSKVSTPRRTQRKQSPPGQSGRHPAAASGMRKHPPASAADVLTSLGRAIPGI